MFRQISHEVCAQLKYSKREPHRLPELIELPWLNVRLKGTEIVIYSRRKSEFTGRGMMFLEAQSLFLLQFSIISFSQSRY